MASSDSQIDKPQHGCPKRAELLDLNTNTGAQSINTERDSLKDVIKILSRRIMIHKGMVPPPYAEHPSLFPLPPQVFGG